MTLTKSILLLSYICIASIAAAIITPALPLIQQQFNLGDGAVEWVISIFLVGYTMGQLVYGPLANRYGRLMALRIGLVISTIGVLVCLASVPMHSFGVLIVGRFLNAFGAAAGLSCVFMLINELSRDEAQAKSVMTMTIVSFTAGVGVAVVIGGLITQYWTWTDSFWVLLVHGILMFLGTWFFKETLTKKQPLHIVHLAGNYMKALKSSKLITFSFTMGMATLITYAYSAAAPMVAHNLLKISPGSYGYWTLLPMGAALVSGFIGKFLMTKIEPWHLIIIGLVGVAIGLISFICMIGFHGSNLYWFFITMAWLYLTTGFMMPAGAFYASNAIADKASASSMMSFLNMCCALFGVIILGYIHGGSLFAFTALICVAWVLLAILLGWFILTCNSRKSS